MAAASAEILVDRDALARVEPGEIARLTEAATVAYDRPGFKAEQSADKRRVIAIAESSCAEAASSDDQHFAAAFIGDRLAGYIIATAHADDDLELDWMMVHPQYHGAGVAQLLMDAAMAWLGLDRPQWLGVLQHNERAIRFYRRFGFEIDPAIRTGHVVPHWVMRRPAARQA